ncbi:prepilin-type N-terminal cleavage/methylation domain-containing protein [Sutcliffiella horikoshii]|uniref:type II secretion system protein n=1 Tax=Sutcliffiella horikoshii TaxID=79883 RepID=UPI001CBBDFBF|nr:prepilin-type N-terminal cleavage/methylation domain-containing protein [Sutcliffiella horikoshii]UAL46343.1 prepilin-type N-terminal cleavage/methylation domain-containing protein [Sutcliffiella horikoshii]
MLQKCRKMLRNEKGLTLIELLAVVVILGIIAAIAIPSIGNIIENSRNDAQIAVGQQAMNAARLALLDDSNSLTSPADEEDLASYLENFDSDEYSVSVTFGDDKKVTGVTVTRTGGNPITLDENGKPVVEEDEDDEE